MSTRFAAVFLFAALLALASTQSARATSFEFACDSCAATDDELHVCRVLQLRKSIHEPLAEILNDVDHKVVIRLSSCLEKHEYGHDRLLFQDVSCCDVLKHDSAMPDNQLERCERACHGAFVTPSLPWPKKIAEFVACASDTRDAISRTFAQCIQQNHSPRFWHAISARLFDSKTLAEHHEIDIIDYE